MFVAAPRRDEPFAERMTVRFSALAPINDPASLYKPIRKVVHRAHPEIRLTRGNHALVDSPFAPLRGWFPIEVFHFPIRSLAQCEHKADLQGTAFEKYVDAAADGATTRRCSMRSKAGTDRRSTTTRSSSPTRSSSEDVAEGRLVVDTRLRDALRGLRAPGGPTPSTSSPRGPGAHLPAADAGRGRDYAVEAAVLGEADVVRLQRRLDTLERRLSSIELRLPNRVYRKVSGKAKRVLRRGDATPG